MTSPQTCSCPVTAVLTPTRAAGLAVVLVWSVLSFSGITTFIYSNF